MITVRVTGDKELAAKFRRLASKRVRRRLVSDGLREGAELVKRQAERPGFGFDDETGRLRGSLRIHQARDRRGRFASGLAISTRVPYAMRVEWDRRTGGRRRAGPPYWLHRAAEIVRPKVVRAITKNVARRLSQEASIR